MIEAVSTLSAPRLTLCPGRPSRGVGTAATRTASVPCRRGSASGARPDSGRL